MGEQSRSPGRPPCPRRLGPVLKAGWLKKQRSIVRNWQQRYFVLRAQQLYYYKDEEDVKPQVPNQAFCTFFLQRSPPGRGRRIERRRFLQTHRGLLTRITSCPFERTSLSFSALSR